MTETKKPEFAVSVAVFADGTVTTSMDGRDTNAANAERLANQLVKLANMISKQVRDEMSR